MSKASQKIMELKSDENLKFKFITCVLVFQGLDATFQSFSPNPQLFSNNDMPLEVWV